MKKLKDCIKKQQIFYLVCIIIGIVLYPVGLSAVHYIKLSIRDENKIAYSKNPVTFVLDYLYAWEDKDNKKQCIMMGQGQDKCNLSGKIKNLIIKDAKLLNQDKKTAKVYIEFDAKSSISGEKESYFWTFDLTWNQKNNRWSIESYGYS